MKRYVLDTNLYVRASRDAEFAEGLDRFVRATLPHIHLHAVVAQELLAGAVSPDGERRIRGRLIEPFERRGRVVTPTFAGWTRAGEIMARLIHRKRMSPGGFARSFVNDCLLAASCRAEGIALVTGNTRDFEPIRLVERLEVVEAWPSA